MMTEQNATFAKYNKSFQEKLGLILLDDRTFADRMQEILKIEFLEQKYIQIFVEKIFEHKTKYNMHPSRDTMETILRSALDDQPEVLQDLVRKYYARMQSVDTRDEAEWIKAEALDFCRKQKVKEGMINATQQLKRGRFEAVEKILMDSLKAGADSDLGYDFVHDFEQRYEEDKRTTVTTGWGKIDAVTSGGLGRGELGVCIAPSGVGKSLSLVHIAAAALKVGSNVIFYTCELKAKVIARRFDACLTGIPLDDLDGKKELVLEDIKGIPGKLIIKKYPRRTATVQTLRHHMDKVRREGTKLDVVIVDYADILRPASGKNREKRHEIEEIYEDLTTMMEEYDVVGWTASQTNRSGLNQEIITMESISEAYNKCFPAHFIFSLSRTIQDQNNNGGRIFIAKNRSGPAQLVYNIFMDCATVNIKVLDSYVPQENTGFGGQTMPPSEMKKRMASAHKKFVARQKGQ